ncbi:MAG TPA: patatin-like phospholipase family protein [Pyrinomonadaceae bacterium]|nr:patatin-like phospholipase family protein [Pyrinomonadaceae bacterium]
MTIQNTSIDRFGNIALCLSGGGYRAATYALGCIDMLQLAGLAGDVKLMSTVSGGTFTGVTYALSIADGEPYKDYFDKYYAFLRDINCVEIALKQLYKTPSPSGRKDLSLIRAAADLYDKKLFDRRGRTFRSLQNVVGNGKPFLELIYNATEFRKGNSFRFRASHNPNVFAGNGDFKVTKEIAAEIPLADIVAASSCFPGAFEPLRFPDDFMWAARPGSIGNELMKNVETSFGKTIPSGFERGGKCLSLPLMDGGIYDNQGISNAVEADRTVANKEVPIIDLFLICDTSARDDDMLAFSKPDESAGWLSMNMLFRAAVGLFILSTVSAGFLIYYLLTAVDTKTLSWTRFFFQYVSPLSMFVVLIGLLIWAYRLFRKNRKIVASGAVFNLWPVVRKLSLPDVINMTKARMASLITMTGDVFMKRIRQLQFSDVMGSSRARKVSFDLIYELNPGKNKDRSDLWVLDPGLQPTKAMIELSACAEKVPTTLWFSKRGETEITVDAEPEECKDKHPDDQMLLLACAQCTTCFCLLKHMWRRWQAQVKVDSKVPKPNDAASPYNGTYESLRALWLELKEDPYRFVDRDRS